MTDTTVQYKCRHFTGMETFIAGIASFAEESSLGSSGLPLHPAVYAAPRTVDAAFDALVVASIEEIRLAHELRLAVVKRYLERPAPPESVWCVGVD